MPQFFFDTDDGDKLHRDKQGHNLPDAATARKEALDVLPDMARDKLPDGDNRTFTVTARDDRANVVYTATLILKGRWGPGFPKAA